MRYISLTKARHRATRDDTVAAIKTCAFLFVSMWSMPAAAEHFSNSYVSFDVPDGWKCILEVTEYVCKPQSTRADGKIGSIIILTAKEVGPSDSPQLYARHLEEMGQKPGIVIAHSPRETVIGRVLWLDAALWNSEIANYKTRYLARTEGLIGVMVTFSAHRSLEKEAQSVSDLVASSVVVNSRFARPELRRKQ